MANKAPVKRTRKPTWRSDRITKAVDPDTGRRVVELPSVAGLTASQRDALYDFEAGVHGTMKAVIRMNKRQQGTLDTPITAKIAAALADLPKDSPIHAFYA